MMTLSANSAGRSAAQITQRRLAVAQGDSVIHLAL
jgi:hypothetical protein